MINEILNNDKALSVFARYLLESIAPYLDHPLTGTSDAMLDFRVAENIGELRAYLRFDFNPGSIFRMRQIASELLEFVRQSGTVMIDFKMFRDWVDHNATVEDRVEEIVFEIENAIQDMTTVMTPEVKKLQSIHKNVQVNLAIYLDLLQMVLSGGPVSDEELNAFFSSIDHNCKQARDILAGFSI